MLDLNELLRLFHRERPQHECIHQREDRGVGADAEGQRQDGDGGDHGSRAQGAKRGDHLLLLLGNVIPLWETMLACIKLGVVVIPATTLLTPDELRDRLDRGRARAVGATQDQVAKFAGLGGDRLVRIVVGGTGKDGWLPFEEAANASDTFAPDGPTLAFLQASYHPLNAIFVCFFQWLD